MSLNQHRDPVAAHDGPDAWFTPRRFAALLGLLIVVTFPQVVAGFEAFVRLDSARFAYPVAFYFREAFWRGEIPLWNPLNNCGTPFLAQWNTMTLYPLSLFYLVLPLPWSFGMFGLGHMFLAGLGMYFLAHRWTGNRLASALAGAAFAFNGLTWQATMWPHLLAALGWMPWVVLTFEAAWCTGGRRLILASLIGAVQLLSGGVEVILFTWLVVGSLWLLAFFQGEVSRRRMAGRALVIVGLVASLAAAQILPFLDLLLHSQRNVNYGDSTSIVMPPWGWANYLVPLFHTRRTPQGIYIDHHQNWITSYYVGVGAVALALVACWRVRTHRVRLLAALAVFGLVMALGSQALVYDAVKRLAPLLGLMRYPVKFVILVSCVVPLLAAYGLSWLESLREDKWRSEWSKAKAVAIGLLGLLGLILCFGWRNPSPFDDFQATLGNACVRALFLVLAVGCIALLHRAADSKSQALLQSSLIVLVWFDVFTHTPNLNPTAPASVLQPDTIRQFFGWDHHLQAGVARALQSRSSYRKLVTSLARDQETDTYGRRLSLFVDLNLLDHVSKFDGFYSLDLKEFGRVFDLVYFTTNQTVRLQDFVGISMISNPTNKVDWVSRDSFLPMITAGQRPVFASSEGAFAALSDPTFEPTQTVYLPLEVRGDLRATNASHAEISSVRFSAHHLEFEVEAAAPTMVVVAQAYHHPWHAYVDGKSRPLWRANYAFQALEVPDGRHRVSLKYEDRIFYGGALVSLVAWLSCAAVWFAGRKFAVNKI